MISLIWHVCIRLVRKKPLGAVGGIIVLALFFIGIFCGHVAPYGYNEFDLRARLSAPSAAHPLGADELGRDLLSRIIYGARISMVVGLGSSFMGAVIASIIGTISAYSGGKVDIVIQRFVDAWMSFPPLFLILTIMAVVGQGLLQVVIVLGSLYGIGNSRVVRGAVISIKENLYVAAARTVGASTPRILIKHILPNVMAPIIILFTVNMGTSIIAEASLSFLGFGIPPPMPSWGGMLSGSGRRYMEMAPWMILWPGIVLGLVVYGINMLGDALRDLLDPRLRGGGGRYGGGKVRKRRANLASQR